MLWNEYIAIILADVYYRDIWKSNLKRLNHDGSHDVYGCTTIQWYSRYLILLQVADYHRRLNCTTEWEGTFDESATVACVQQLS